MSNHLNRRISRFMRAPLAKLPAMVEKANVNDMMSMARAMESDTQRMVFTGEYVHHRACGQNHASALKLARAKIVKVRRVLGYAYPKEGLASVSF